jgi:hypothetical protein
VPSRLIGSESGEGQISGASNGCDAAFKYIEACKNTDCQNQPFQAWQILVAGYRSSFLSAISFGPRQGSCWPGGLPPPCPSRATESRPCASSRAGAPPSPGCREAVCNERVSPCNISEAIARTRTRPQQDGSTAPRHGRASCRSARRYRFPPRPGPPNYSACQSAGQKYNRQTHRSLIFTTANAFSTNSRTRCVSPVARTKSSGAGCWSMRHMPST